MNEEELEVIYNFLHYQQDKYTTGLYIWECIDKLYNLYFEQQKELEKLRNPVICGRNIDEIVNILMALDIEKQYKIEVTMENLKSLMGIYQAEVEKSIRDAEIKIIDDLTGSGCKINFTLPHYNFDENKGE